VRHHYRNNSGKRHRSTCVLFCFLWCQSCVIGKPLNIGSLGVLFASKQHSRRSDREKVYLRCTYLRSYSYSYSCFLHHPALFLCSTKKSASQIRLWQFDSYHSRVHSLADRAICPHGKRWTLTIYRRWLFPERPNCVMPCPPFASLLVMRKTECLSEYKATG
jgi:hypothetical protein